MLPCPPPARSDLAATRPVVVAGTRRRTMTRCVPAPAPAPTRQRQLPWRHLRGGRTRCSVPSRKRTRSWKPDDGPGEEDSAYSTTTWPPGRPRWNGPLLPPSPPTGRRPPGRIAILLLLLLLPRRGREILSRPRTARKSRHCPRLQRRPLPARGPSTRRAATVVPRRSPQNQSRRLLRRLGWCAPIRRASSCTSPTGGGALAPPPMMMMMVILISRRRRLVRRLRRLRRLFPPPTCSPISSRIFGPRTRCTTTSPCSGPTPRPP
mmetsp:Transcript_13771/g.39573  ORF Transcript_13771/g.39573 Transcript_13771/m.39573 type:complete len:264 (-) Transcript_13771:321-1112(-)